MKSERVEAAARTASMSADLALRRDASVGRCASLIRKLQESVDRQIFELGPPEPVCRVGCDFCCHKRVEVSPFELAAILDFVSTELSAEASTAILDRASKYDGQNGTACPLLVDHKCSVYAARPFACRGMNSLVVEECHRAAEGQRDWNVPMRDEQLDLASAVQESAVATGQKYGAPNAQLLLGTAIAEALRDPHAFRATFPDVKDIRAIQAQETPATGVRGLDQYVEALSQRGSAPEAIQAIAVAPPSIRNLLSLIVPRAYESEDEQLEWEHHWDKTFEALANTDVSRRESFEALALHVPSELAYHGTSVKERYSLLGDLIVERIVKPLFPDLYAPITGPRRPGKLRVGYISHALRYNNGGRWALGWLENHGEDIETYSFNLYTEQDRVSKRFQASSDHYYHLTGPVEQGARMIKALDLDALIFTDIGVCGTNTQYASMRLARVQCTAWGHPVTSGLPTIDAYLSSDLMEPPDADSHYREELVRLPNSGLYYEHLEHAPAARSREDFGLPTGFFAIMAQNLSKCNPRWDFLFKEISDRLENPIGFIEAIQPYEQEVTRRRLERAGVRVQWIPRMQLRDYYRLLQLCDVSLDTPAWNGGNTTIELLTLGTPMVTLPTAYMRGRHSLAFNQIANARALNTSTPDEYVALATDPERLTAAMAEVSPRDLYEDALVPQALDDYLHRACGV